MEHDFDKQRSETLQAFEGIRSEHPLLSVAVIEFQFVPVSEADWAGFDAWLSANDYRTDVFDDPDDPYIQAETVPIELSAERIWFHEERMTVAALEMGFAPDGWGFFGSGNVGPMA